MHATREPPGSLVLGLTEDEAELLRRLLGEMDRLLDAGLEADPVVGRLFPRAYETPDEERAYRDLVGGELKAGKLANIRTARAALGDSGEMEATLSPEETEAWLALLTDLRLAIGTRLDVSEETMEREVDADDPDAAALSVLHWLGWVQGTMVEAMR